MKYEEARRQLRYALRKQQTIGIPRLRELLSSLHFSTRARMPDSFVEDKAVEVVKKKGNRVTVIRWNGEEYIWRPRKG